MLNSSYPTQPATDLTANRMGLLAEAQRALLERRIRSLRWTYLGIVGFIFVFAVVITIGVYSEFGDEASDAMPFFVGMDVVLFLLMLPLVWRMSREVRKVRDDIHDGRVQAVTGVPTLGYKASSLTVAGQWFPLPAFTRSIDWKATSTFYYVPRSRVIVAMEKAGTP